MSDERRTGSDHLQMASTNHLRPPHHVASHSPRIGTYLLGFPFLALLGASQGPRAQDPLDLHRSWVHLCTCLVHPPVGLDSALRGTVVVSMEYGHNCSTISLCLPSWQVMQKRRVLESERRPFDLAAAVCFPTGESASSPGIAAPLILLTSDFTIDLTSLWRSIVGRGPSMGLAA